MPDSSASQNNEPPTHISSLAALLERLQDFFQDQGYTGYLVGGSLRDLLQGHQPHDLDLAVQGDALQLARKLADSLHGYFATLRLEKGVGRVILSAADQPGFVIDLAAVRGRTLIDDLALRDFTINALALPLEDIPHQPALLASSSWINQRLLIDPFQGLRDLQHKTIHAVQDSSFKDDPLRLLRAFRIAHRFQFQLARSTAALMLRDAQLLAEAAPERIRDELIQIMSLPDAAAATQALDEYHLLPAIFPALYESGVSQRVPHTTERKPASNGWKTLSLTSRLMRVLQDEIIVLTPQEQHMLSSLLHLSKDKPFMQRWQTTYRGSYSRSTILTCAALICDLLSRRTLEIRSLLPRKSSPQPERRFHAIREDLHRLAFGRQATDFILLLQQHTLSPWEIEPQPESSDVRHWRAAQHYFQRYGEQGIDLVVFCLVRQIARLEGSQPDEQWQQHAQTLSHLLDAYYHTYDELIPPPLIDGQDIMAALDLKAGPLIGALLAQVRNAQLDGLIQARQEALTFAREQLEQSKQKMQSEKKQPRKDGTGGENR